MKLSDEFVIRIRKTRAGCTERKWFISVSLAMIFTVLVASGGIYFGCKFILIVNQLFRSSHFWFLVTFGSEVKKILCNLCLHFARQHGQDLEKGKKITQL